MEKGEGANEVGESDRLCRAGEAVRRGDALPPAATATISCGACPPVLCIVPYEIRLRSERDEDGGRLREGGRINEVRESTAALRCGLLILNERVQQGKQQSKGTNSPRTSLDRPSLVKAC